MYLLYNLTSNTGGFMSKIIDKEYIPLTYKDVAKEVFNLYGSLLELYMELFNKYEKLCVSLDEVDLLEEKDLDAYVVAQTKLSYFMKTMPDIFDEERELYRENEYLLPFLVQHIEKRFNLKGTLNINSFSAFDPLIFDDFKVLKENYPVIRMIRAIKYFSIFNEVYSTLVEINNLNYTDEEILTDIGLDYSDIESVRTINQLRDTFYTEEDTHLFNKYKSLFMFCNPCIEHLYFSLKFGDPQIPHISEDEDPKGIEPVIKMIKSKTVNTMVAINNNEVINRGRGRLIKELNSEDATEVRKYYDNKDELYLLDAYILQSYPYYSLQTIMDLDQLFTLMSRKKYKGYENIKLSKKVVNYFFRKDAYNNPAFAKAMENKNIIDDNGYQRKRKDE